MREDIAAAIAATPSNIQSELNGPCKQAMAFLEDHLPDTEQVRCLSSAAVNVTGATTNSALVVTDRRLLFVAPRPQALAWRLTAIDNVHAAYGFMVESGGATTHLGVDSEWGNEFVNRLHMAMAVATLTNAA
jgi:hypothetical protein